VDLGRAESVSVVVPTYNRRLGLARTLSGLANQGALSAGLEVLVVVDGSPDDTAEWLRTATFPFTLRPILQQNQGPAAARNAGIRAATGSLILFVDDDTEPQPGLVAEHVAAHREADDLAVTGPLGSLPRYPQPWVAWEQRQVERQYQAMLRGEWAPTFRQFWTGNASVRREHLLAAGGFDTAYLRAEDVELALRLHRRGLRFRFRPSARVLHHVSRSLESWCRMHRAYGEAEPRIFGEEDAFLTDNFGRLHRATKLLVRATAGQAAAAPAARALRGALLAAERAGTARGTHAVCSALANLLFWDALATALGREKFRTLTGGRAR
jgi:GT2 family glycosyltransferase